MNCAELEVLICDHVDGTLEPGRRAEFERHLEACAECAELARDAAAGAAFLERVAAVEPPPELITRILFQAPWTRRKSRLRRWLDPLLSPILQPRYAMSMAMTIVSFAMLARFLAPVRSLRPEDLRPAAVWSGMEDRAYRVWGRAIKFYDNLKVVYEIQTTLKQWQQQAEYQPAPGPAAAPSDDRRLPVHALPPEPAGSGGAPAPHTPERN